MSQPAQSLESRAEMAPARRGETEAPASPRSPSAARRVLLLHGFTGSSLSWGEPVLDGLAGAGIEPVALDLPGHGQNAGEVDEAEFTLQATLSRISDRAAGGGEPGGGGRGRAVDAGSPAHVTPAGLVGYSMGGRIALHYALRESARVRRLVLESASPGLETEEARARRRAGDAALAEWIVAEGVEAFVDRWEALPLFASQRGLPAHVRESHRRRRLANDARSLAAALDGLGTGVLPSLWRRLESLRVPTLMIVGAFDEKFVEIGRRMERAMPDARLVVVPDAGHTVHLERPEQWLSAVTAFLAE